MEIKPPILETAVVFLMAGTAIGITVTHSLIKSLVSSAVKKVIGNSTP